MKIAIGQDVSDYVMTLVTDRLSCQFIKRIRPGITGKLAMPDLEI